jgi:hypothetical protein
MLLKHCFEFTQGQFYRPERFHLTVGQYVQVSEDEVNLICYGRLTHMCRVCTQWADEEQPREDDFAFMVRKDSPGAHKLS